MSTAFKGLTITVGADTKQFNKEMKAVDRSIKDTNRQVNELQKGLELEFNAGRFSEAQRLAQKAISETELKAKALNDQLKYLDANGADKTASSYQKLQAELIKTENQAVILKRKLDEIKDMKVEALAKQFEKVGGGITKAGQALAPFSAAAAAALAGLAAIGKSTIEYADTLKTLADGVNLSAEELQKWQYIAMQTDVTNEDLQKGLIKTQGAFASLAKGDIDKTAQALLDLGFTADQAANGMEANFSELIKRLSEIEDPVLQAAYANELFGEKMATKIIPMLKSGGEALAALAAEYESFGALTNEQIDSLAEFDNVLNKLKYSFKVIKDQIGLALLPVMQALADFVSTKVVPAVQKLTDWFTSLSDGQRGALLGTLAFVAALAPALLIIGKITTGIGALIKSFNGISKALSVLSAHPIIAVVAVVVALLVLLYTKNEQFRDSINNLVSTLGTALMPILEALGSLFNTILTSLTPLLDIIAQLLIPVVDALSKALTPLISLLADILIPVFEVINPILEKAIGIITKIANVILKILVPVINKLGEVYASVFGAIPKIIQGILDFIERTVNATINFINGIIRQINKLGDVLGFTIKELDTVSLNATVTKEDNTKGGASGDATTPGATDVISSTPTTNVPTSVTNNDYSNKDVVINVTVENYAENVDIDDMIRQINLKLAESL